MSKKLCIPISNSLFNRLQRLPWGHRSKTIILLVDQLVSMFEKDGPKVLALLHLGKLKLEYSDEELSADDAARALGDYLQSARQQKEDEE